MATLAAFNVVSPSQPDLGSKFSTDLGGYQFSAWPDVDYAKPSVSVSGSAPVDNLPVSQQELAISGEGPIPSFERDYYYRIHVIPTDIDLGNVIVDQLHDVEVWNAYPASAQNLAALVITGGDGLLLEDPVDPPTVYAPLESRMHVLTAYVAGPPVVDATFTFDFPSEDPVLSVIGNRIVVWPFQPDWDKPVIERLSWLTDVLESYDGTEQGRELRSVPRTSFGFKTVQFLENRQHLNSILWSWQSRKFMVPRYMDRGILTAPAVVNDSVLNITTTDLGYHVGGYVVLQTDPLNTEAAEIVNLTASTVTLKAGLRNNWPANTTVYPASLARMKDTQTVSAFANAMEELSLQFELEGTANVTAIDSSATYRSYPVLEEPPDWVDDIDVEYKRVQNRVDGQTGAISVIDTRNRPITIQSYLWTRIGRSAINALKAWMYARKGRLNPIWVPTFKPDITLADTVLATQSVMKVKRLEYYRYTSGEIGRRDILIILHNGTKLYRRITGAALLDADNEELFLSSTMGQDIAPSDVAMVSFLQFSRLEADAVEFAWIHPGLVQCNHMLRGLPDDV